MSSDRKLGRFQTSSRKQCPLWLYFGCLGRGKAKERIGNFFEGHAKFTEKRMRISGSLHLFSPNATRSSWSSHARECVS